MKFATTHGGNGWMGIGVWWPPGPRPVWLYAGITAVWRFRPDYEPPFLKWLPVRISPFFKIVRKHKE